MAGKVKRQIVFGPFDIDPALEAAGIDPKTIDDYEWRSFYDMFLEGSHWSEVMEEAAFAIKYMREGD